MQGTRWVAAAGAAVGMGLAGCGNTPVQDPMVQVTSGTVIRNVSVIDTRSGAATPAQAVVVEQGRIRQVLADRAVVAGGTARVIDGSGQFVVPGYLDMHTHTLPAAVFQKAPMWPMLIAHGVTGIREMVGAPPLIAAARGFNAARAAGQLDAPEILQIPGMPVAGAMSAASGVQGVMATQAVGGQFVKLVAAGPEAQAALFSAAKAQGLDVAGHLSAGTDAVASTRAGMKAIEHLGGVWSVQLDCARDQAAVREAIVAGKGAKMPVPFPPTYPVSPFRYGADDAPYVQRIIDSQDPAACNSVARAVAQSATWQVPTMIRLRTMLRSDAPEFRNDPNLQYVDPTTRGLWHKLATEFAALQPASAPASFRAYYPSFVSMLSLLRQHGVAAKTLTGSDIGGIWVIPGISLHQEFRELAQAGFTPLEVLQAATLNGARFLNREATMGTVEANRNADLVLLEANPVLDVANLSKIAGVMNAGKYFSRAELEAMKARVAAAAAAAPARDISTVLDPTHKH